MTLSSSSYKYSNATGFWQAIVNSNGCSIGLDGIFGNLTTWYSAGIQNGVLGYNNGGIINAQIWNGFQDAVSVYGPRLNNTFFIDGFGTRRYTYYGGIDPGAVLGWNPFASQWLFSPYPVTSQTTLIAATPNRTIGSFPACG
jgi:hypothetical protein